VPPLRSLAVPVVVTSQVGSASEPPTLPPAETESAPAAGAEWERILPGGDCACADGSEFNFWVRDANPAKVVLYLEGGGACFDATSCAFTDEQTTLYDWNISADDDPALREGIFDFGHEGTRSPTIRSSTSPTARATSTSGTSRGSTPRS
jgi:hypothetical protein